MNVAIISVIIMTPTLVGQKHADHSVVTPKPLAEIVQTAPLPKQKIPADDVVSR
tara:strand:- start:126 stop:287 length:162 start_codon:yes stop_codon:yes gene_type:complete